MYILEYDKYYYDDAKYLLKKEYLKDYCVLSSNNTILTMSSSLSYFYTGLGNFSYYIGGSLLNTIIAINSASIVILIKSNVTSVEGNGWQPSKFKVTFSSSVSSLNAFYIYNMTNW